MKKIICLNLAVLLVFGITGLTFAMHGMCGMEEKSSSKVKAASKENAQEVTNKICPVSGEKIDENTKVTHEYKGKIYNFCCASCIGGFKKDPQKYIKKIEEEKTNEKTLKEFPTQSHR